jgi:hypothetical protein
MPETMRCPGCKANLRIRPEFAGKRIKCPRCATAVRVPAPPPPEVEEVEEVPEEVEAAPKPRAITRDKPTARKDRIAQGPARRRRREEEPQEKPAGEDEGGSPYVDCPKCGAHNPKKVLWTAWGSFYGPAMFNHVRCRRCKYCYNGKSGGSNLIPAIIFVTLPTLLILGIVGFVGWYVLYGRFK